MPNRQIQISCVRTKLSDKQRTKLVQIKKINKRLYLSTAMKSFENVNSLKCVEEFLPSI